ncbi:MAG: hypothetical protein Q8Q65_02095 [bacterium]|nr:hypothetical protein [bacterium]
MHHHSKSLEESWKKLSIVEQLANIGAEVGRTQNWQDKGNLEYKNNAFYRSLELIDLSLKQPQRLSILKELTRLRELLVDFFMGDNQYNSTRVQWQKYFYSFNYAAAMKREQIS